MYLNLSLTCYQFKFHRHGFRNKWIINLWLIMLFINYQEIQVTSHLWTPLLLIMYTKREITCLITSMVISGRELSVNYLLEYVYSYFTTTIFNEPALYISTCSCFLRVRWICNYIKSKWLQLYQRIKMRFYYSERSNVHNEKQIVNIW